MLTSDIVTSTPRHPRVPDSPASPAQSPEPSARDPSVGDRSLVVARPPSPSETVALVNIITQQGAPADVTRSLRASVWRPRPAALVEYRACYEALRHVKLLYATPEDEEPSLDFANAAEVSPHNLLCLLLRILL